MRKISVAMNSFHNHFPKDGSPISLKGIGYVIVSDVNLNNLSLNAILLSTTDPTKNQVIALTSDGFSLKTTPRVWDALLFILDTSSKEGEVSFDLELVSHH